jgi:hypothetical protein
MREEVEECEMDEEPQGRAQAISSFNSSFKYVPAANAYDAFLWSVCNFYPNRRAEVPKKENFIVIPASAAAVDASKPLLLRNRPTDVASLAADADDKAKFFADLETRCDDNTLASYSRVEVPKFGEGILRGLGWTPGAPVGKTNAGYVLI